MFGICIIQFFLYPGEHTGMFYVEWSRQFVDPGHRTTVNTGLL